MVKNNIEVDVKVKCIEQGKTQQMKLTPRRPMSIA